MVNPPNRVWRFRSGFARPFVVKGTPKFFEAYCRREIPAKEALKLAIQARVQAQKMGVIRNIRVTQGKSGYMVWTRTVVKPVRIKS